MFDATQRRSRWPLALVAAVGAAVAGVVWFERPALVERAGVLAGGGNPLADPFAAERADVRYPESPLTVSLALESGLAPADRPVDRDGMLAFADQLATDLGYWLLTDTGASDIEAAERTLWSRDHDPDRFVAKWALLLQQREVYARDTERLSAGIVPEGYRYAHSDELVLLFAHVAWRLDLAVDLVRSPVHHYAVWREPGGQGARGIEPTCFRRVDALGALAPSDEPSVGRRLTFPPDHYPSGAGGIRNPKPLPPGVYATVSATALPGDLLTRLAARYGGGIDVLDARLAEHPDAAVAQAVYRARLAAGLSAWEAGDVARVRVEAKALDALRTDHGGLLPDAPDELALDAVVAFADGDDPAGFAALDAVFAYHEPTGAPALFVASDAHAAAMWLELEHRPPKMDAWNRRIVPLLNRWRDDPARIARLCTLGRTVLADAVQTPEALVPECRGAAGVPAGG